MLHMFHESPNWAWLMNPWVQMSICLPVFLTGMWYFGRSAWKSVWHGVPNMNVLISLGGLAAFLYSLTGAILHLGHDYLFFETTASIITPSYFLEITWKMRRFSLPSVPFRLWPNRRK